jgi:hypothetical protein
MEEYRVKLKLQNLFIGIICMILAIFSFLMALSETGVITWMPAVNGDSHVQSMWRGFITGASTGILILMITFLVRNIIALCDEQKLKKLYVKETDEREIQIWTSARATSMQIFLMGGLVAGIAAGYFNMVVSITIIACIFIHSILGFLCMLYYRIKL